MIFFGEQSPNSFIIHLERNHQGLDNELIYSAQDSLGSDDRIRCRERLGGTLRYYYRDAA